MKYINYLGLLAALFLVSCHSGTSDYLVRQDHDGEIHVNLVGITELSEPVREFNLTDHYNFIGIIDLDEDPRTFLRRGPDFLPFDDESVLVYSTERAIRVRMADGAFIAEYGREGRGPGEYMQILFVFPHKGRVYLEDTMSNLLIFEPDGSYVQKIPFVPGNPQFCTYLPLDDRYGVIGYSSLAGKEVLYEIVDDDFKTVRSSPLEEDDEALAARGAIRISSITLKDGQPVLFAEDTIRRVSPEGDTPWILFEKGTHRPEPGEAVSPNDITGEQCSVQGTFAYVRCMRNGAEFHSLIDLRSGKPVHHSILRDIETALTGGFAFDDNGTTRYLFPSSISGDLLICSEFRNMQEYYCFRLR